MTAARWPFRARDVSARALAVTILVAVSTSALAEGPVLESSESALRCLVAPSADKLRYDKEAIKEKIGGLVRVRLTFEGPDAAPEVEITYTSVDDELVATVLDRVKSYRLPCLRSGDTPLVATQEFKFDPRDGRKVFWNGVVTQQEDSQKKLLHCLTGAKNIVEYPLGARGVGVVFANFTFTDPHLPPAVQIVFDGGNGAFAQAVREYSSSLRLPCMTQVDAPIKAFQQFRFLFEGSRLSRLEDTTVAAFVGAIEKPELQHVRFDFTTMSCPFEVLFILRQPYLPNDVGEVESPDPNRRDFVNWLRGVNLRLPERTLRQVLGDSMMITVPCAILDLT